MSDNGFAGLSQTTIDDIHCVELGASDAPAIVCCHGMALDHRDLLELLRPLASNWRIILWDMPGHGLSGPLPANCSLQTMTDTLEIVIDRLDVAEPVLLGFSFGGMVAQSLMRRGKHPVRGLIAMGCFAPFNVDRPLDEEVTEQVLIAPMTTLPWSQVRGAFAGACSAQPDVQEKLLPAIDRLGREGLIDMTRALMNAFEPDPSFRIDVPLLAVRGAGDLNGEGIADSARALIALSPAGFDAVIEAAGHCVHLDQEDAAAAAISKFLTSMNRASD